MNATKEMENKNFTTTLLVNKSPEKIFQVIKDVRAWWVGLYGEKIEGASDRINEEFSYRAGEGLHYSRQKLVEIIPNKKLVWLVTDSHLDFLKEKDEWTGTKISFEISEKGYGSEVRFTHEGLIPVIECYEACSDAWGRYIQESLLPLLS